MIGPCTLILSRQAVRGSFSDFVLDAQYVGRDYISLRGGFTQVDGRHSGYDLFNPGSNLSLRGQCKSDTWLPIFQRMWPAGVVSVLDAVCLGSDALFRRYGRVGFALSVHSRTKSDGIYSVLSYVSSGSTFSLRNSTHGGHWGNE